MSGPRRRRRRMPLGRLASLIVIAILLVVATGVIVAFFDMNAT
jgi:hypothetical protein